MHEIENSFNIDNITHKFTHQPLLFWDFFLKTLNIIYDKFN